jgi:ferredoxin
MRDLKKQFEGKFDYLNFVGDWILFFDLYEPFKVMDEPYLNLDNYYVVSNNFYKKQNQILLNFPYLIKYKGDLKKLFATLDGGEIKRNGLYYKEGYGSRMVLGAMSKMPTNIYKEPNGSFSCGDCGLCRAACPTKTIGESGVDYENCIRHLQNEPLNPELSAKIGNRLLGCDDCQRVCPHNSHVSCKEVPEDIKAMLKVDGLDKKGLLKLVGKNYKKHIDER